jgi:hypothetical protein
MKYQLKKELPFMKIGTVFEKGTWCGGGWGVDKGYTKYVGGSSSHNGIEVFTESENNILDSIILNKDWVLR